MCIVIEIQRVRERSRAGIFQITNILSKCDGNTPFFELWPFLH